LIDNYRIWGINTVVQLPALLQQAEEERKKSQMLKNPGGWEKLIEEGKKIVTVDAFEGLR